MILKKIKLSNFRCFKEIEIEFDDELTVLVGENGAGKTTVLSAIAIAISTFLQGFPYVSAVSISRADARIDRATGEESMGHPIYPVSVYAEADENGKDIRWSRSLNTDKGKTTIVDAKQMVKLSKDYYSLARDRESDIVLPIILYYGTGRLFDSHRQKKINVFKNDDRFNGYIDCMDSTANIKLMYKWFQRKTIENYQRIERGEDSDPILNTVYEPMEYIFGAVSGYSNIKIQYSLAEDDLVVWYTDEQGGMMCIPLSQLSAGYRNTISLVADISYRIVVLNPGLKDKALSETQGIVLIDEIDQHLHPAWQRRIIGDLRHIFPRIQFIVSTHAPSIIGTINSKNLRKLSGTGVVNDYPEVYGKDSNGILSSVFETEDRPKEIKDKFAAFYSYIDSDCYQDAQRVLDDIYGIIDEDDPELTACTIKLDLANM